MIGFLSTPVFRLPSGRSRTAPSLQKRAACSASASTATEKHELDGAVIIGPFKPAGHHILVKTAAAEETTSGGLILSGTAKDKPTYGKAVAVGPGRYFPMGGLIPMAVSEGDTVLYAKYGGTEVKYDGERHMLVTQDDVLCVLDGGKYETDAVRPFHDRILVKLDKQAEELQSGILLTSGSTEKPSTGMVTAIGEGRVMENGELEPVSVKIGDKVLYGQYAGTEVKFGDDACIFVRINEVLAHWEA
jgi:chaperonin GroES